MSAPVYYPQGVDIYHSNEVDIPSLKVDFVIHKVTEGADFVDPLYHDRMMQFRGLWGGTHWITTDPADKQVDNFLRHLGNVLPAIDLEGSPFKTVPSASVVDGAAVAQGIRTVTGKWPLLYSSSTGVGAAYVRAIKRMGQAAADAALAILTNCPFWVSSSEIPPTLPFPYWKSWIICQYTQHRVTGATAVIDIDKANFSSLVELQRWWSDMSVSYQSGAAKFIEDTKGLDPNTEITLAFDRKVVGAGFEPSYYAVRLNQLTLAADVPPPVTFPTIAMKVTDKAPVLNVHVSPAFASDHILPPLHAGDTVNIKPGETPEPANVNPPRYLWVALADRAGYIALSETESGISTNYLIPA